MPISHSFSKIFCIKSRETIAECMQIFNCPSVKCSPVLRQYVRMLWMTYLFVFSSFFFSTIVQCNLLWLHIWRIKLYTVTPLHWPGSANTAASVCLYRKQIRSLFRDCPSPPLRSPAGDRTPIALVKGTHSGETESVDWDTGIATFDLGMRFPGN